MQETIDYALFKRQEKKTFERLVAHYGNQIESATMTHWPGDPNEVVDNLVTGVRKGNF